jgi:preprotein translocase subunit SecE
VNLTNIIIAVVVIGVVFGLLWWQGQLRRLQVYVAETREELRKCTWPSWEELKGSTVLVSLTILAIGVFTVVVDRGLYILFFYVL